MNFVDTVLSMVKVYSRTLARGAALYCHCGCPYDLSFLTPCSGVSKPHYRLQTLESYKVTHHGQYVTVGGAVRCVEAIVCLRAERKCGRSTRIWPKIVLGRRNACGYQHTVPTTPSLCTCTMRNPTRISRIVSRCPLSPCL
jgi:hypothetical protein